MIRKFKIIALIVSILIFIIALTQPAFYTSAQEPDGWSNSFGLLIFGWSGVMVGGAGFAWIANPLMLFAWVKLLKKTKVAMILSALALLFSWSFLLFDTIMTGEDGHYSIITAHKAGYWLWLASIAIFFISTVVIYYLEKNIKEAHLQRSN